MDMLAQLRNIPMDRCDVDDLVALAAFGKTVRDTYVESGLVTPEWLDDSLRLLKKEIADRRVDQLMRERKLLQTKKRSLMSREEQRKEIDEREAEIERQLGITQPATAVTP